MTDDNQAPVEEPAAEPAPPGEPDETVDVADVAEAGASAGAGEPAEAGAGEAAVDEAAVDRARTAAEPDPQVKVEELTGDLQRLQAEFVNYKRRVERDRELIKENATFAALAPIIEVLDTIDRAREHEPLEGGFKAVAEQLERTVGGVGLVKFGEVGEAFDPNVHEALSHIGTDPEVAVTTCKVIAKAGYKIGDRVVRAAQVLVVDPAED